MALSGKPGSPGIGKLVIPSVYISFSPWPLELHCKNQANNGLTVINKTDGALNSNILPSVTHKNPSRIATQRLFGDPQPWSICGFDN